MAKFTVGHIVNNPVFDLCPIGILGQKDKLRFGIDKLLDEPRGRLLDQLSLSRA